MPFSNSEENFELPEQDYGDLKKEKAKNSDKASVHDDGEWFKQSDLCELCLVKLYSGLVFDSQTIWHWKIFALRIQSDVVTGRLVTPPKTNLDLWLFQFGTGLYDLCTP